MNQKNPFRERINHGSEHVKYTCSTPSNQIKHTVARIASTFLNAVIEDFVHLWHCKYERRMVDVLPQLTSPIKLCKDYVNGKQQEVFLKKSTWRAKRILQKLSREFLTGRMEKMN
ncbi:hypothetical protein V8G54_002512 [Vigna mungo]|uniref:Uncharacterized protein n=1 Tax=Vigna mungo TaxID=3915 RepID=A0AAQ3P9E4_VIGMU